MLLSRHPLLDIGVQYSGFLLFSMEEVCTFFFFFFFFFTEHTQVPGLPMLQDDMKMIYNL